MMGSFSPLSIFQSSAAQPSNAAVAQVNACKDVCQCIRVYHTNTLVLGLSGSGKVSHEVVGGTMAGKMKLSAEQKRK